MSFGAVQIQSCEHQLRQLEVTSQHLLHLSLQVCFFVVALAPVCLSKCPVGAAACLHFGLLLCTVMLQVLCDCTSRLLTTAKCATYCQWHSLPTCCYAGNCAIADD